MLDMRRECKLCGAAGVKLAKAHIIPKSLYGSAIHHPLGPLKLVAQALKKFERKSPNGIYDPDLVCISCEARFSPWDAYANKLLLKTRPTSVREHHGERLAYIYDEFDYSLLKLFFLSLLWRANSTSHDFFSSVKLSRRQETELRTMILNGTPGGSEDFAVIFLARFDDSLADGFLNPWHERYDGVGVYRFFFSQHVAYIKATTKPTGKDLKDFVIRPERELVLVARDFRETKEFAAMVEIVRRRLR